MPGATPRYWDGSQWVAALGTRGPIGPAGPVGATGPYGGPAGGDLTGSYPNPNVSSVAGGRSIKAPTVWRGALIWDTDNSVPGGASYQTEAILNSLTNSTGVALSGGSGSGTTGNITISTPWANNSSILSVSQAVGSTTIADQNTATVMFASSFGGQAFAALQPLCVIYNPGASVYRCSACCQVNGTSYTYLYVQVWDGASSSAHNFYFFGTYPGSGTLYPMNGSYGLAGSLMCIPIVVHSTVGAGGNIAILAQGTTGVGGFAYGAIERLG